MNGKAALVAFVLCTTACEDGTPVAPLKYPLANVPADLAAITFAAVGQTTAPYAVLELRRVGGFSGFVVVNGRGQPVWFYRTQGSPFSFTRRRSGNFVFLDSDRGLVEISAEGEEVHQLPQEERPGRRMHHDIAATDFNTLLFIAEEWQGWGDSVVNGEAIWEWDPEAGVAAKRWSSFDYLDPKLDWGARSRADDWLHANSISVGSRGNILLSLNFLNQVISISPDFGSVEWRMGGVRATIHVDDPFSGQHTAQEVGPGRILLFDNGFERSEERYSRPVEYELRGEIAVKTWEWRPARDNWARVISSARRLPNGNTLVAFGVPRDVPPGSTGPIEAYEVTEGGAVMWHLAVGGDVTSMYRATPIFEF